MWFHLAVSKQCHPWPFASQTSHAQVGDRLDCARRSQSNFRIFLFCNNFYVFHCAMCSVLRIEYPNQSWMGTLLILIIDNCLQVVLVKVGCELLAGRYPHKTNSLGLKINSWKMNFLLGLGLFSEAIVVSGTVTNMNQHVLVSWKQDER